MSSENVPAATSEKRDKVPAVYGSPDLLKRGGSRLATSLNPEDEKSSMTLMNAMSNVGANGRDAIGETFQVTDFVLYETKRHADMDDIKSPLVECQRLILLGSGLALYATTSQWAIDSFFQMCSFIGLPPWSPAKEIVLAKAGRTYKFTLAK